MAVEVSKDPRVLALGEYLQEKVEEATALFFPSLSLKKVTSNNKNYVYKGQIIVCGWIKFNNNKSLWLYHRSDSERTIITELVLSIYTPGKPGEKGKGRHRHLTRVLSCEEITPSVIWEAYSYICDHSGESLF